MSATTIITVTPGWAVSFWGVSVPFASHAEAKRFIKDAKKASLIGAACSRIERAEYWARIDKAKQEAEFTRLQLAAEAAKLLTAALTDGGGLYLLVNTVDDIS